MSRKSILLICLSLALGPIKGALAESSHDAVAGYDPDLQHHEDTNFTLTSTDGKHKLRFRGHVQQNNIYTYDVGTKKSAMNMEIKRARFTFTGNAFDPRLTFLFQVGLEKDLIKSPSAYTSPGSQYLRDYYINAAVDERYLQVRIGKFRTPFSRQQLISTSQMQFYDQRNTNEEFQLTNTGRDVGLMLHNGFSHPMEWAFAAVSNGLVARLGYNYNHIDGYEMSDWTSGDFRFAAALNGFMHTNYVKTFIDDMRGGADCIVKFAGFSTNASFFYQYQKANPDAALKNSYGAGIDAGYLIHRKIEPVLRYSWLNKYAAQEHEALAGLNYYFHGHHFKVQGYAGANLEAKAIRNWLGGVQFQFAL